MMDKNTLEIKDKLISYATSLDTKDWVALNSVFDKSATAEYGSDSIGLKIKSSSRNEIVSMCKSSLNGCGFTQHLLGNFIINIDNENATSKCYVRVYHVGLEPNEKEFYEMFGEYIDDWRLIDNSWFIIHRKLIVNFEKGNREKVLAP
jgi:hypothetical protein